jgi:NodT family efflux transporter outer membrane factor (OMF) lipoprotein
MEEDAPHVSASSADYRKWWRVFGDPVLDALEQTAYAQNIPLRAAGARVFEARARLGIAIGEQYPQVQQATGSVLDIRESERDSNAPQRKSAADQFQFIQAQAGAIAVWELDFWGKFRLAVESEDANFLSSIAAYDNALVTLTADVAQTYVTLRTLEERLRIVKESVDLQRESLRIARARFAAGSGTGLDVQQAIAQLRVTEAVVPQLEAEARQTDNALCILLGMPPGGIDHLIGRGSGIPNAPQDVAVGIPVDLLRRRPDIRTAELQAAAQSARIGVAKADLYPAFTLNGAFGLLSTDVGRFDLGNLSDWGSRYYTIGPSFTWDLLNYGRITNSVRVQDARFQALVFDYQNTVLRVQKEVENALNGFLQFRESMVMQVEAVRASQQAAKLAMVQYRNGATGYTTVIVAQRSLLVDQDSLANLQGARAPGARRRLPCAWRGVGVAGRETVSAARDNDRHGGTHRLGRSARARGGPADRHAPVDESRLVGNDRLLEPEPKAESKNNPNQKEEQA